MIFSIHGYYKKQSGRKTASKIEAIVFACDASKAKALIREMFDGYPADIVGLNVAYGSPNNLEEIYAQRPELRGISPEKGYVYDEFYLKGVIAKYFK